MMTPAQQKFIDALLKKNPQPDVEISSYIKIFNGGYASPILLGTPEIVDITPAMAKKILRKVHIFPRIKRPDQHRINKFAALIKTGQWQIDATQPIMITKSGVLLNGRHRLRAIIKAGTSATIPIINRLQTIKT